MGCSRLLGFGDCEDYVTIKYFSLVAAHVFEANLRYVYVSVKLNDKWYPHMVLAYFPNLTVDGDPLILDNLTNEIQPLSKRTDFQPNFSFNTKGLWGKLSLNLFKEKIFAFPLWQNLLLKQVVF